MIGVGVVALIIIILIVMAIIIYNNQKELSALKKEDTFLVKAVKKITNSSAKFVSDKLELNNQPKSEEDNKQSVSSDNTPIVNNNTSDKPNE